MTQLLSLPVYGPRQDDVLLKELNALCDHHTRGCGEYARIVGNTLPAKTLQDVPFIHVGLFKHMSLQTGGAGTTGRILSSSSTSGVASKIALDSKSSQLQSQSSLAILKNFVGAEKRPLLVLDNVRGLRQRGAMSARIAAALSLQPLSSSIHFLLSNKERPISDKSTEGGQGQPDWESLLAVLTKAESVIVYGFTWILWKAWAAAAIPPAVATVLAKTKVIFVHSGGWKKLEAVKVDRQIFDNALLEKVGPGSKVIDYYGLVEQVGVVYPMCECGNRMPPVWADIIVRDPVSLLPVVGKPGQLQLMNPLAWGGPYHSVLTEDMAMVLDNNDVSSCSCGRSGKKFRLLGRMEKAEVRGCANV